MIYKAAWTVGGHLFTSKGELYGFYLGKYTCVISVFSGFCWQDVC